MPNKQKQYQTIPNQTFGKKSINKANPATQPTNLKPRQNTKTKPYHTQPCPAASFSQVPIPLLKQPEAPLPPKPIAQRPFFASFVGGKNAAEIRVRMSPWGRAYVGKGWWGLSKCLSDVVRSLFLDYFLFSLLQIC